MSRFLRWRCNNAKAELDKCFKLEKQRLLKELNKDFEQTRSKEDGMIMEALGQKLSFQEYLEKDKGYMKARQQQAENKSS